MEPTPVEQDPERLRLTGHGLILRPWVGTDLAAMVEIFDDPDIAYRTPFASPFDTAAARAHLRNARTGLAEGRSLRLAITADGDRALGEVLLNVTTATIGYCVGAAYRGRRLAVRAVEVMTDHAHGRLGLPRVHLEIEPGNRPSEGVARAAGFRLSGREPERVTDKGREFTVLTWTHDAPSPRSG
ncbi:GNAT family N-acetyltransferase [Actinomadura viridis]|uniref:GNAT family N-acetyltransferase n=1 Tax=Actinomadura viridis TaxID=58110 RepID=UPI0036B754F2